MHALKFTEKNQYIYLLIIIIIAAVFRLFHLNFQSLWLDEIYSIVPANPEWPATMVVEYSKKDQPPAYFLSLHYWFQYFPYTDYYARLFSAILGILGVIAIFFLGKSFKNSTVGLIASLITALNYFHIYYSQEVRFYSMVFLLTTLSYLFFLKCYKNPILINYFFYSIVSTALIYTHYYGMFVLFSQFVIFLFVVLKGRRDWKFITYSVLSGIAVVVLFQPWIPIVIRDSNVDPNLWWIIRPKEFFLFEYLYDYFGKDPYQLLLFIFCVFLFIRKSVYPHIEKIHLSKSVIIKTAIILICIWLILGLGIPHLRAIVPHPVVYIPLAIIYITLFLIFLVKLFKSIPAISVYPSQQIDNKIIFMILSTWILLGYLIPYTRSITNTPMMIDRYTMICLPVIIIIFSLGLDFISSKKLQTTLVSILCVTTIINFVFFNHYYTSYHKGQFREAAAKVIKENINQSKIFTQMVWHYSFYFDQFNSPLKSQLIDPNTIDFETTVANEKEVWVLQGHDISIPPDKFEILNKTFRLAEKYDYYGGAYAAHYVKK